MSDLIALKKQRSILKSLLTRIHTVCTSANVSRDEVQARLDKTEEVFKKFEKIQDEIDNLENGNDDQYRADIEQTYFHIKTIYYQLNNNDSANDIQNTSDLASAMQVMIQQQTSMSALLERVTNMQIINTSSPITTPEVHNNRSEIKLPPIQIPDFDGNLLDWIRFRDLFEALVHNKPNLSNVERLEYLQTKVKGEALVIIKHLKPTNNNYQVAWDLLKQKYDNIEKIKSSYLELLLDQPGMKAPSLTDVKRLYNSVNEAFNALKTLEEGVEQWSGVLLFNIEKKLDNTTAAIWYREKSNIQSATFQHLLHFLEKRISELESSQKSASHHQNEKAGTKNQFRTYTSIAQSCPVCTKSHYMFQCNDFKELNVEKRRALALENNVCFNCLRPNHKAIDCRRSRCKKCGRNHNTLLHIQGSTTTTDHNKVSTPDVKVQACSSVNVVQQRQPSYVMLPTAIVMIQDNCKVFQPCRALLDSGSQCTLITEACVQRLGLQRKYDKTIFYGIGVGNGKQTKGKVNILIKGQHAKPTLSTDAFCLSHLTQNLPHYQIDDDKFKYFNNLNLADPKYNYPGHIGLLLGADLFSECCLQEKIAHPTGSPVAFNTIFGWVMMGKTAIAGTNDQCIAGHVSVDLEKQLRQFWEIEDISTTKPHYTIEEEQAELHYKQFTQRNSDGRYVVKLPLKNDKLNVGESKSIALKRFFAMQNKIKANPELKGQYDAFMIEYLELNHMKPALNVNTDICYLPHHAIIKPSSSTTKLRVVFDASCKTTNGQSLNDNMLIGPTIQNDLVDVIIKFQKYEVAIIGDIEKMYRTILVHEQDQPKQRILWRQSETGNVQEYDLTTVTYGTSSAPFLATRTLKQIAIDNSKDYPAASNAILQNFYVDDFICSVPDIQTAITLKNDVCHVLNGAGMNLRKWSSNSQTLLDTIPADTHGPTIAGCSDVQVLGLNWNTMNDCFEYNTAAITSHNENPTKREVLSIIAKFYDPLGWCSPVVIQLKIFMQRLWLKGLNWDDELPHDLSIQWKQYQTNLDEISKIQIPRWYRYNGHCKTELHGFSDASELAYSATIYIRIQDQSDNITTTLIAAKTRVAPVKQVSLPKLELCGAHLLSKLMTKIKTTVNIENVTAYAWTDSSIVLAWLADYPRRWKSFVANRTSQILEVLPASHWRHVKSKENPADLATRGISAGELINQNLWWHGPSFMQQSNFTPNNKVELTTTNLEERRNIFLNVKSAEISIFERYSNLTKLIRVTAYILRFTHNAKNPAHRLTGVLNTAELKRAQEVLIIQAQYEDFDTEMQQLIKGKQLSTKNKLTTLSPFIDNIGIMRVGGRLENANIPFDQKHPVILSKQHPITKLIAQHYHHKYLHAGRRMMSYLIGLNYWIISAQKVIKNCIAKCIICTRYRAKPYDQKMGNIPSQRLQQGAAFMNTGVDYAGPIQIKAWKGRGSKTYKAWIAVFVCLVVKAIHIEIVTELSSEAFIAAFRRFVARRGKPHNIYSDNGTNFVGANNYLKEVYGFLSQESAQEAIIREANNQQIQWHFSPPSAPHFGGMWEAGVKSVKYHLRRVLGNTLTTYEEINTVLCQIEACLNSRPLCKRFEDDVNPLTPAHFLIMRPLQTVAEEDTITYKENHLTRWQFLQRLVQQFWKTWSTEYIAQLQQRQKWSQQKENIKVNDVVLIKDDNLPPGKWAMGRVMEVHPGKDGLVRVATLSTANGKFKRPIVKLCPLTTYDDA